MFVLTVFVSAVFFCFVTGRELTDAELHRLPNLFHLDNYERCLSQEYGLYCLGTFELSAEPSHPLLEFMKEHTKDRHRFNRTLLHRGYCVSQRCPERKSCMERNKHNFERTTSNSSQICNFVRKTYDFQQNSYDERNSFRFERCVAEFARQHSFTARLSSLQYCITHEEYQSKLNRPLNNDQWMFIYAVVFILLLNIVGTLYDWTGSTGSSLLLAWSLRVNWARFTRVDESALMKSLAPLQLSRLVMQWIIIYGHTMLTHFMMYVHNPEEMERYNQSYMGNLIRNGTSLVQVFILISCFLTGLNFLLLVNKNSEINLKIMIKWIFKRLFRIFPVYLLVLGFATTWWAHSAEGPLWSTVRAESYVCRRKFWTQVFFVNNLVEPSDMCLLQSWGFAIDIQMYIISLFTIYILLKKKANGPKILAVLFVLSVLLNVLLAYFTGWEPMVKLIYAENLRVQFKKTPTLIHISIWGNLPACFLGLFIAYFYLEMTKKAQAQRGTKTKSINDEKVENNADGKKAQAQRGTKTKSINDEKVENNADGNEVAENEVKRNEVVQNEVKRNGSTKNKNELVANEVKKKRVIQNEVKGDGVVQNENERNGLVQNEDDSNDLLRNEIKTNEQVDNEIESNGFVQSKVTLFERWYSKGFYSNWYNENSYEINRNIQNYIEYYEPHQNEIETNEIDGLSQNNVKNYWQKIHKNSIHKIETNKHIQNIIEEIVNKSDKSTAKVRNGSSIPKVRNRFGKPLEMESIELNNNVLSVNKSVGSITNDITSKNNLHGYRNGRFGLKKMGFYLLQKAHIFALPCLVTWIYLGTHIETFESKAVMALYVGMERIVFSGLFAIFLISIFNYDSFLRRLGAWNGWQAVGRLVYTLTVLHWCVTLSLAASRPQPVFTSVFRITVDWLATICFTYLLALPICLLVELPAQKFFDILLNKLL